MSAPPCRNDYKGLYKFVTSFATARISTEPYPKAGLPAIVDTVAWDGEDMVEEDDI